MVTGFDQEADAENIGYLINDVARLLAVAYGRRLDARGLTRAQWQVVFYLKHNPGVSQSTLAELLGSGRNSVTLLVDRLVQKQFVVRLPDPADRRVNRLELTQAALMLYPEFERFADDLLEEVQVGFSVKERARLFSMLERLRDNVRRIIDESSVSAP
ncbi:MAG: MarR family winged helix-turn-helix transcriptional regulator [Pseudomonadales bacterium]